MKDPSKTNQELIAEISVLKQRIQNLEQLVLDHKKAEETMRASEAKYRLAFESTSDGIFTIDRNFNISSITPSVERQLGYKVEKMINKPIQDLNILTPESLTRAVSDVKTILSGVEVTGAVYEFIAKDGTRKIGEVTGTPIIQEGRILGTTAIVRDITERKKTEEALRESEERLRDIMFSIADWVWEVDENGVYTYSSQKGVDLLGKSREDIIGKTPFDFMPPDEAKRVAAIFSEIVANKAPIKDLENWNISRNGEKICLLTNGVPILDEEGNLKGYRGIDKDITEHKRADARFKQQTDAMDAANDGMALLNEEGKYVYINKAHVKVYGYENAEELIGKSWRMLYDSDVLQRFDQEIMPEFSRKGDWYGEAIGTKKNGGKFPQELSLTAMANGGLICVVRDITERMQAEAELKESKALIEAVVENVPLMIFLKESTDLRFVIFNRAGEELLGYDRRDLIGKNNLDLFPPEQAAYFMAKDREVLDGEAGMLDIPEEPILTARKSQRLLHTRKVCIRGSDGATKFLLGISEDITERKKAEDSLKETLESLRHAVGTTIQVMASAVEARDPYTAGHQTRSADLARAIAMEMGLPQEKIDGIRMAGSIHDLGKLSIPAEILSKPTKLSKLEFSLIKEHARQGYEMLKNVESPWPLAEIVRQHHERMDGSGYPRNLKGDDILIEARILAVADVVEAMASHRPYRPGLGIDAALNEIEKNRGIFYDDAVADACLRLFREKGFKLEKD